MRTDRQTHCQLKPVSSTIYLLICLSIYLYMAYLCPKAFVDSCIKPWVDSDTFQISVMFVMQVHITKNVQILHGYSKKPIKTRLSPENGNVFIVLISVTHTKVILIYNNIIQPEQVRPCSCSGAHCISQTRSLTRTCDELSLTATVQQVQNKTDQSSQKHHYKIMHNTKIF